MGGHLGAGLVSVSMERIVLVKNCVLLGHVRSHSLLSFAEFDNLALFI